MVSTVLFIRDQPVGYTVTIGEKSCHFKPAEHSDSEMQAPSFEILYEDDDWEFDPFFDWELRNQIIETLPFHTVKDNMKAKISAAP